MKRSQRRQMQEAIKEIPFAVFCLDTEKNDEASKLAETMKAPFFTSPESMEKTALYVVYDQEGTCLTDGEMTLRGDYHTKIRRLKHNNLSHEAQPVWGKIPSFWPLTVFLSPYANTIRSLLHC